MFSSIGIAQWNKEEDKKEEASMETEEAENTSVLPYVTDLTKNTKSEHDGTSNGKRLEMDAKDVVLAFSPYSWAKLRWFQKRGDTEISGFGITHPDDPFLVIDFITVKQEATTTSVEFDDMALNNYLDDMQQAGIEPNRCLRLWLHTHPMESPNPSTTDETTFSNVFMRGSWGIMFIIGSRGETFARLGVKLPNNVAATTKMRVTWDYDCDFPAANHELWEKEYQSHIKKRSWQGRGYNNSKYFEYGAIGLRGLESLETGFSRDTSQGKTEEPVGNETNLRKTTKSHLPPSPEHEMEMRMLDQEYNSDWLVMG